MKLLAKILYDAFLLGFLYSIALSTASMSNIETSSTHMLIIFVLIILASVFKHSLE